MKLGIKGLRKVGNLVFRVGDRSERTSYVSHLNVCEGQDLKI